MDPYILVNALTTGITIFIITTLTQYLRDLQQRPAKFDKYGRFAEITYHPIYKLSGWAGIAVSVVILFVAFQAEIPQRKTDLLWILVIAAFFLLVGSGWLIETGRKICLFQKGILSISPWSKDILFFWEDVREISFSKKEDHFKIVDKKRQVIRVFKHMNGLPTLVEAFQAKLPPVIYHQAVHEFFGEKAVEPRNKDISLIHAVSFDTTGWQVQEDHAYRRILFNELKDVLRLQLKDEPPMLPAMPTDVDVLRNYFRHQLAKSNGVLISLDSCIIDGIDTIRIIAKYQFTSTRIGYVGSLIIPFQAFSFQVRVSCQEEQYDPTFQASLLGSLSDDEQDDQMLIEPPLSRLRRYMRRIEATMKLSAIVKRQRPFHILKPGLK